MGELPVGLVECPVCGGEGGFDDDGHGHGRCEECGGTGSILEDCLSPDQEDLDEELEGFLAAVNEEESRHERHLS